MQTIQGNQVPIYLSFDNEVSWQLLVCLTTWNLPTELPTNVVDTFCGPAVGTGNQTFNPTGTAVAITDAAAGQQVTYGRLLTAQTNGETIKFRVLYPGSGSIASAFFLKGSAKVTSLDPTFEATGVVQFSWTLTGEGTLDITYP